MSGHPLWPDDIERKVNAVLDDVQRKLLVMEPVVAAAPILVTSLQGLIAEARAELAALESIRERLFHP